MLALGLQGSPRKNGNSDYLLKTLLQHLSGSGFQTQIIDTTQRHIEPCKEIGVCETQGFCPIDDDMAGDIYGLLRQADIVVAASPIFFYNVSSQLKALIDRCQTLWARRYMLKLKDPGSPVRRGFLLSVGATSGKKLFDGVELTAKYFFDGIDAAYKGSLTYRKMEKRGDIKAHATVDEELKKAAGDLARGLSERHKVLFACRENACRSQMAAAFARYYGGDRLDASCAGSRPARQINPVMVDAMQEKGIDMAFRTPQSIESAIDRDTPHEIITMGCGEECPVLPGVARQDWDLPDPADRPLAFMRSVRDDVEMKVKEYLDRLGSRLP
jgi:multimeric flavodoxin WrbA